MPELPEVEVISNGLEKSIKSLLIEDLIVRNPNLRQKIVIKDLNKIKNKQILSIKRKAKYILINLSDNLTIIIHLGMTGKLIIYEKGLSQIYSKHDHVIFYLSNQKELVYNDVRRFGLIKIAHSFDIENQDLFAKNGPEPFSDQFNPKYLFSRLNNRNIAIKQAMMDNNIVVGIGNIYACEILFLSKIAPTRKCNKITLKECELLVKNSIIILKKAINLGGSSFKDYVNSIGKKGSFQENFSVYSKNAKPCVNCGAEIIKINQAARSTFFCQICQI